MKTCFVAYLTLVVLLLPGCSRPTPESAKELLFTDVQLLDMPNGDRQLVAKIKGKQGTSFTPENTRALASFLEKDIKGNTHLTEGDIRSQWDAPPVDWKDGEEILRITYSGPKNREERIFYGYELSVLYNDQVQDFREWHIKAAKE